MKRSTLLITSISLVASIAAISFAVYSLTQKQQASFSYVSAEQRNLVSSVEATGQVKAAQSVDLSFVQGGRITQIPVKVGDAVKAGQILMQLDNAAQAAQVAQARAYLNQKAAGATVQNIAVAQAAVDAANADLQKTKADTNATVAASQSAVDSANNNLKLAAGGENSQIVSHAYESAVASLESTLPVLSSTLNQADAILGVDSISTNLQSQGQISALDPTRLTTAKNQYLQFKTQIATLSTRITSLSSLSGHQEIEAGFVDEGTALGSATQLLSAVTDVLNASVAGSSLPADVLSAKQASIITGRAQIANQQTALVNAHQAIDNAKNSLQSYTIAANAAQTSLTNTQASVAALIKLKQAAYDQALAALAVIASPTRAVDLAPLRAGLSAAEVNYDTTILRSPIDGIVSRQDGSIGQLVSPSAPLVSVINQQVLQIEVEIPETNIHAISLGQKAQVTLDAAQVSSTFEATVIKLAPATSASSGSYTVTLQFDTPDTSIKVGMTANVRIQTGSANAAVSVPHSSVFQKDGNFFVLLDGGSGRPVEHPVTVGLHGQDGWWQITDGLTVGEKIIRFDQ